MENDHDDAPEGRCCVPRFPSLGLPCYVAAGGLGSLPTRRMPKPDRSKPARLKPSRLDLARVMVFRTLSSPHKRKSRRAAAGRSGVGHRAWICPARSRTHFRILTDIAIRARRFAWPERRRARTRVLQHPGAGVPLRAIRILQPAVGVFVDGVYLGVNAGTNFDTFDLEGIEKSCAAAVHVASRNVTGGAVLLTTRRPKRQIFRFMVRRHRNRARI